MDFKIPPTEAGAQKYQITRITANYLIFLGETKLTNGKAWLKHKGTLFDKVE